MLSRTNLLGICAIAAAVLGAAGCQPDGVQGDRRPIVQPLGAMSDCVWAHQEANAEHSDFVVYENEFGIDSEILNTAGEDHVRQIAARLASGQDAQVLVERSMSSARPDTTYHFRIHPNPDLDLRRREIVVGSLRAMGIGDAEARVVVAPSLAPKYRYGDSPTQEPRTSSNAGFGGFSFGAGYGGGGYGGGGAYGAGSGIGYGGGYGSNP
jgi:hypothetical protein